MAVYILAPLALGVCLSNLITYIMYIRGGSTIHSPAILENGIPWVLGIAIVIILLSGKNRLDRLDTILVGLALLSAGVPQVLSFAIAMNKFSIIEWEREKAVALLLLLQIAFFSFSHLLLAIRHGRSPVKKHLLLRSPSAFARSVVAGSVIVFIGVLIAFASRLHVLDLLVLPLIIGGVSLWAAGDAACVDRFPSTNTFFFLLGVVFWFTHELISSAYYLSASGCHATAVIDTLCRFSSAFLYQPSFLLLSLSVYRFDGE
ncbi:MAG: hypothetical protein JW885_14960 [Deltaproteobacteria bacterium]|nr:hypothetical protein [Candidatus Zymogenaceae bacterium]